MPTIIDPFHIATLGVTADDPITIATDGFIVFISEEIIEVPKFGGAFATLIPWLPDAFKKKKKKITATVIVDNVEYSESVVLEDISVTVDDIQVKVERAEKPKIFIQVKPRSK